MRTGIFVVLCALAVSGCAADVRRNDIVNHLVAKCAPGGTPLTGEVDSCMHHEAAVAVAGDYCSNWHVAPNQMERCKPQLIRM